MRDNYNTYVVGTRVVLLPFREQFAETYMRWMQDPFIREMTASEDLVMDTVELAAAHCRSVLEDDSNCTFLIAEKIDNSQYRLIGDINLFLQNDDTDPSSFQAEVNIMVAEADARRKGLAKESLFLAFRYATQRHHATSFLARISDENAASINLFKTKLAWHIESHSDVFSETSFKQVVDAHFIQALESSTPDFQVIDGYDQRTFSVE